MERGVLFGGPGRTGLPVVTLRGQRQWHLLVCLLLLLRLLGRCPLGGPVLVLMKELTWAPAGPPIPARRPTPPLVAGLQQGASPTAQEARGGSPGEALARSRRNGGHAPSSRTSGSAAAAAQRHLLEALGTARLSVGILCSVGARAGSGFDISSGACAVGRLRSCWSLLACPRLARRMA